MNRAEIPVYRVIVKEWPKKVTTSQGILLRVSLNALEEFIHFADLNDLAIVSIERMDRWP
jgi:hypothetical protein